MGKVISQLSKQATYSPRCANLSSITPNTSNAGTSNSSILSGACQSNRSSIISTYVKKSNQNTITPSPSLAVKKYPITGAKFAPSPAPSSTFSIPSSRKQHRPRLRLRLGQHKTADRSLSPASAPQRQCSSARGGTLGRRPDDESYAMLTNQLTASACSVSHHIQKQKQSATAASSRHGGFVSYRDSVLTW
ncbi:unnamed protein product [Protopolystoma xenopodis]|uniref:Uncharacterized protein n=1 Tax=Protopolystoma xenopodis TaxID=117903 RepID=A0A3S5B3F8_9PLAT|nr:unnamed protein product [Protopolystoma xenopodis]